MNATRTLTVRMAGLLAAASLLLTGCGATVTGAAVVLELSDLGGRAAIQPLPVTTLHTV